MKDPGAESSYDFGERTFILSARLTRQFEFGGLFVTVRQKRSSIVVAVWSPAFRRPPKGGTPNSATSVGGLFVIVWARSTLTTTFAVVGLELRFQLIELGFLLRRQNGQHLLTELKSRAHQLGLEARRFR